MLEKFGQDIIDDLVAKKFQTVKYTNDELKEIGDLYKEFANQELKARGLWEQSVYFAGVNLKIIHTHIQLAFVAQDAKLITIY